TSTARSGGGKSGEAAESRRADADFVARDLDRREPSPESDNDPGNPAVAHKEVRADPDYRHRNPRRQRCKKPGEIGKVGGPEQNLGRAPDAKPGLLADRRV